MKRFNAREEQWEGMEIRGIRGYFCDLRIDRATVPGYFHFWELADGDSDGTPCRNKSGKLVNFFGTFITTGELPVDDVEHQEGFINTEDEWNFMDGFYSFPEIEQMERGGRNG